MTAITDPQRLQVVEAAERIGYLHQPYVFGAAGPEAYDCSGLALAAWRIFLALPHNSVDQAVFTGAWTEADGWRRPATVHYLARLLPGDLVFYSDDGHGPQHVAVFLGRRFGLYVVAQATDTAHGTEVIKMHKYVEPVGFGFVGRS